jgi:hypothetical protein
MADVDDGFQDAVIDMVARDVSRDRNGKALPTWPVTPTLQIDPIPDTALGDAILPFDEEMIGANSYDGTAWDGNRTRFFRDMLLSRREERSSNGRDAGASGGQGLRVATSDPVAARTVERRP